MVSMRETDWNSDKQDRKTRFVPRKVNNDVYKVKFFDPFSQQVLIKEQKIKKKHHLESLSWKKKGQEMIKCYFSQR